MINRPQFNMEIVTTGLDGPNDRVEVGPSRPTFPTRNYGLMRSQPFGQFALSKAGVHTGLSYQLSCHAASIPELLLT